MYQHEVPPSLHDQKHYTSCTLNQTTSNWFEVIHNCSVHTLVTESELWIIQIILFRRVTDNVERSCDGGCNNGAKLYTYSCFFLSIQVINLG